MAPRILSPALFCLLVTVGGAARAAEPKKPEPPKKAEPASKEPSEKDQEKGKGIAIEALTLYQSAAGASNPEDLLKQALAKFQEAEKLYPTGQVLRMEGYTLMGLKRYLEAAELIERALKDDFKPLLPAEAEEAQDQLDDVKKNKIATVGIQSDAPDATVRIDDADPKPVPARERIMPGMHRFRVEAPDHEPVEQTRIIGTGETPLTFSLPVKKKVAKAPPPKEVAPPPPQPHKPLNLFGGWFPHQRDAGIALGAAGLGAGMVGLGLGVASLRLDGAVQTNIDAHQQNYDPSCRRFSSLCLNDIALINNDGARAAELRNAGMVTGIVGLGVFVTGTAFLLFAPDGPIGRHRGSQQKGKEGAQQASVRCGPTGPGVGCLGRF